MRIFVTGGAGFIGSHTVDYLLERHESVLVLDNLSSGHLENLNLAHPNLEFIEGDILEFPLVKDLIANCDAVLHLAAIASVPISLANPIYTMQVNTQGIVHVLQAIRELERDIPLVYASSAAVYGNLNVPADETMALNPQSPYALQKCQQEQYAQLFQRLFSIRSIGLRYFNVYGSRQNPVSSYAGVLTHFLTAYQAHQAFKIEGDGLQSRDFIHVQDVAHANYQSLIAETSGEFNIATGKSYTLLDLTQLINELGDYVAETVFLPARVGDILYSCAKINKAKNELSFEAQLSLEQGLHNLITLPPSR